MDPSLPLISIPQQNNIPLPDFYQPKSRPSLITKIERGDPSTDKYTILYSEKEIKNNSLLAQLGSSIFTNPESLKMANIDSIYKLTRHIGAFMNLTTPGPFKFCDIDGNGSTTQYIQWRRPDSIGYGLSNKWPTNDLDMNRFMPFYGESNTGNFMKEWKSFISRVKRDQVLGVDLVVGNINIPESSRQEFLSFHQLSIQALMCLKLLATNGDMVLKFYQTSSQTLSELVYLISLCFDKITFIRPLTADGSEKYLICKEKKKNTENYELILEQVVSTLAREEKILTFLSQPPYDDFIDWLIKSNYAENKNPNYIDAHEALIIWNLPSEPINKIQNPTIFFSNIKN